MSDLNTLSSDTLSPLLNQLSHGDDLNKTLGQMADISGKHLDIACQLTEIIVNAQPSNNLSAEAILAIFKQSLEAVSENSPMKSLLELC